LRTKGNKNGTGSKERSIKTRGGYAGYIIGVFRLCEPLGTVTLELVYPVELVERK